MTLRRNGEDAATQMRPGTFGLMLFAALGAIALALAAGLGWFVTGSTRSHDDGAILLLCAATLFIFFLALGAGWALFQLRIARPLEALSREIETLSHASRVRTAETPASNALGNLPESLDGLIGKLVTARDERQSAIDGALEDIETYRRRLETILLDLSEGVIVCNLDHRVLLYNQSASEILGQPQALGLGRRLFGLIEREPVLEALKELTDLQQGDKTQKLRVRRRIKCELRDSGEEFDMRLALICSDEVETEGYVLTFSPVAESVDAPDALPPRPEFYDFDLFRREPDRNRRDVPLKELRCVVFDTETTGLNPSAGDELISIGAVRVINGRIVRNETFERLIDPGMKIPKPSIRFHGIKDKDVKGKEDAASVLPQFHKFCGSAALVAHNAAFDMKFFELKEKASGVSFTNPVLDLLLLSAFLHDHTQDHSLAATARRLGVEVSDRHSALGDALTEAEIFLAMLDPLADRGVVTLGDALDASRSQVKIRKMQAQF